MNTINIKPFDNCSVLDDYHRVSNFLAKIFYHYKHPISEDMLLGLGAGVGFIYWHMKIVVSTDYVLLAGEEMSNHERVNGSTLRVICRQIEIRREEFLKAYEKA